MKQIEVSFVRMKRSRKGREHTSRASPCSTLLANKLEIFAKIFSLIILAAPGNLDKTVEVSCNAK